MNWAYIAGFFDGEGSVCLTRNHQTGYARPLISFPQAGPIGKEVLLEIQKFFTNNHIKTNFSNNYSARNKRGGKVLHHIKTTNHQSVLAILKGMMPYLIVKRTAAQDFIRYYTLFPSLEKYRHTIAVGNGSRDNRCGKRNTVSRLTEKDVREIKALLNGGKVNQTTLAQQYGVIQTTISSIKLGKTWKHITV